MCNVSEYDACVKQLSGLDATFLYLETATTFGHVTGLMILERPDEEFDPYAAVYAKFASLVGDLEPLRRRLVEVPLGLDHPYWIADPGLDLDFHIREIHLARPGLVDQLADQVSRIVGRPMDRSRPLWEVYVIDGLADGRWALLSKYHHATIDGAAGQILLNAMTDTEPDTTPPGPSRAWEAEEVPSTVELLRRTAANLAGHPVKALRVQTRLVRQVADATGIDGLGSAVGKAGSLLKAAAGLSKTRPKIPLPTSAAPPTPWNKTITGHRRFAMRTTSLDNVKQLKALTGGTVNDIVMAICAGGLRQYLLAHDALPDRPLRAMVPVSVRTGDEEDPWTNRVSAIFPELPTDCEDPLERVVRCRDAMNDAKRLLDLMPATQLGDMAQFSAPVLSTSAMRLASRFGLAHRLAAVPFNLVISNVPGPRQPLYFAGAKLAHQFPVSIVTEGQGLNITVASYMDRLDFGFIVDRELVPDVWDLADMHIDEIGRLFQAAGVEPAQQAPSALPRRGRIRIAQPDDIS